MVQKKKSRTFAFLCSFLPGAAEMYYGFMKNGFSMMVIFFAAAIYLGNFGGGELFVAVGTIVWFFGFFHARNIANTTEEEFMSMKDVYIWEEFGEFNKAKLSEKKNRLILAILMIIAGVGILWNNFYKMVLDMIPEKLWERLYPVVKNIPSTILAVVIIVAGIMLIRGKKEELNEISE